MRKQLDAACIGLLIEIPRHAFVPLLIMQPLRTIVDHATTTIFTNSAIILVGTQNARFILTDVSVL